MTRLFAVASLSTVAWVGQGVGADEANRTASNVRSVDARSNDPSPRLRRTIRVVDSDRRPRAVLAMAVHPTRPLLCVAATDHRVRFLGAGDLRLFADRQGHRDRIRDLAFSPDGRRMASVGNDGRLMLWSINDGVHQQQVLDNTPALATVSFGSDGNHLIAAGFDRELFVLGRDASQKLRCDHGDLRCICHDEDQMVLGGRFGLLHIFVGGREVRTKKVASKTVNAICRLRDTHRVVSVGDDGVLAVYDLNSDEIVQQIELQTGRLFCVVQISSDRVAVAGSDDTIRFVDLYAGDVVEKLSGHTGSISSLGVMGDHLYSTSYDATVRQWDLIDDRSGITPNDRMAGRDVRRERTSRGPHIRRE